MIVEVKQGLLEGGKQPSVLTGKDYFFFTGIPYAEPPVGDLRFRPPVPAKKWEGVLNAQKDADCCVQSDFGDTTGGVQGSEDCLYLNVYTPEPPNPNGPAKAVMVFIHGGGYFMGTGRKDKHSPDYLIGNDIVLVTLNYRLHVLGFLNMNIPSCPGNCGLKDQSLALRWVKENIHAFGGDPNNITIFGESAGGSSIHLQMISPMSKGLINRAILQSGNAIVPWAVGENPESKGFEVGKNLGFDGTDPEKLVEFLKKQSAEQLNSTVFKLMKDGQMRRPLDCLGLSFFPSVEKITENAFLPDYPKNLLKTAVPMPVMTGVTEKEGVIIFAGARNPEEFAVKSLDNLTDVVKYNIPCDPDKIPQLAAKMKEFYFKCDPSEVKNQFLNMFSDVFFLNLYEAVDYIVKSEHPVYFYEFKFCGQLNQSIKWMHDKDSKAIECMHADEIGYLFYCSHLHANHQFKTPEKKVIENITKLWTNFAKTGNPTVKPSEMDVEWKPHTQDKPAYLEIGENLKVFEKRVWNDRRAFWTDALKTFAQSVPK